MNENEKYKQYKKAQHLNPFRYTCKGRIKKKKKKGKENENGKYEHTKSLTHSCITKNNTAEEQDKEHETKSARKKTKEENDAEKQRRQEHRQGNINIPDREKDKGLNMMRRK